MLVFMIVKNSILNKEIYIDSINSNFSIDKNELEYNPYLTNYDYINLNFDDYKTSSIVFCINLSNGCNLKCDYCFNSKKTGESINFSDVKRFLDLCFKNFPDKEKYYVDLSGKGEPLLFLKSILDIKKYCEEISNKINREVLVSFVCNGTLLTKEVAELLQRKGILFGVSLDGNELIHNKHRKTKDGNDTYKTIIDNVNSIPNHEYVGCATTLTKDVFSLIDSIKELSKTFNTIGYKPARNCNESFDEDSIDLWLKEYDKLTLFLLEETTKGNDKIIKTLLNGDDYFGKFIKRIILNQRCLIRCDGGLSRLTLNDDGNIYICPSACDYKKFKVGNLNFIDFNKQSELFDTQMKRIECSGCSVKYICGGECLIEKTLSNGNNKLMCKYKKHLILLAMYFVITLQSKNNFEFMKLLDFTKEVGSRNKLDKELDKFLKEHPEYNFIEGKKVFDSLTRKY